MKPVQAQRQAPRRELRRRIRDEGLFATRYDWYLAKLALLAALLTGAFLLAPSHSVLAGIFLGLFCQQAAFIGHDIGHDSVLTSDRAGLFNPKHKPFAAWLIGNVCFGVDGLNWSAAHDGHHRVNLRFDEDPQNTHMPWLLYDAGEVSYYCKEHGPLTRFQIAWLRHQHLIMIPLMLVYGKLNIMRGEKRLLARGTYLRFFGVALHVMLWAALLARAGNALAFFCTALCVCGIIHIQILLSHAYMPRFTLHEQHRLGWIRYQVLGTQNVETRWYDGWLHGGLQYQIEHHLFPGLPRHSLPIIKPYVKEFCARHDLPYRSDPFLVCIVDMLRSFHAQSRGIYSAS